MVIIGRVTPPSVGLAFSANNVQLKIGQKTIGPGSVYISQNSLVWLPTNNPDGITIFWKQISVHGISTEPSKCIYFMLDHELKWPGIYDEDNQSNGMSGKHINGEDGGEESDDQDDDDDDDENFEDAEETQITECWLIPEDQNSVVTMYQAMTECQALHPDSGDSISGESDYMDGGEDDGFEFGNASIGDGNENAVVEEVRDTINNLSLNNDRFADADE